jgi:hypothetical protein
VASTDEVGYDIVSTLHELVRVAQEYAPVGSTGNYRKGIHETHELQTRGWYGRLVADDFKSHWIEFGTSRGFPPHHVLQRAVTTLGMSFTERR